jgi:hypothetical protein
MRVPILYGDRRMEGMPSVRSGPTLDASHFGAKAYRDLYDLAGALGDQGLAFFAEAQKRQRRDDQYEEELRQSWGRFHSQAADQEQADRRQAAEEAERQITRRAAKETAPDGGADDLSGGGTLGGSGGEAGPGGSGLWSSGPGGAPAVGYDGAGGAVWSSPAATRQFNGGEYAIGFADMNWAGSGPAPVFGGGSGTGAGGGAAELLAGRDEDRARAAVNGAQLGLKETVEGFFSREGFAALGLPEEMEERLEGLRKELEKGLDSGPQRERFAPAWEAMANLARERVARHYHQQLESFGRETRASQNQLLADQAAAEAVQPDGIEKMLAGPYLPLYRENLERLNQALPPDRREEALRLGLRAFHRRQLEALAEESPERAGSYLADERVAPAFAEGERKALGDYFQRLSAERREAEAERLNSLAARDDARAGLSPEEARRKYRREFPEGKMAAGKYAAFRAARLGEQARVLAERASRLDQLRREYLKNGLDPDQPLAGLRPTAEEAQSLTEWGEGVRGRGGRDEPPDLNYLFRLEGLSREKLLDRLLAEGGLEELYRRAGGMESPYLSGVLARAGGKGGRLPRLEESPAGWAVKRYARDLGLTLGDERDGPELNGFAAEFAARVRAEAAGRGKPAAALSPEERERIYARMLVGGWGSGRPAPAVRPAGRETDGADWDDEFWGR